MSELRIKIKRQIEIVGLVLAYPGIYTTFDLEDIFDCTSITIKRDLSDIRSLGITIHSIPRKGVAITSGLTPDLVKQLLSEYALTSRTGGTLVTAAGLLAGALHEKALVTFTLLQRAIDGKKMVRLSYRKDAKAGSLTRIIAPLLLFEKQCEWRLLADENGKRKQFLLQKMIDIEILPEKSVSMPETDFNHLVESSFGAWVSEKSLEVKLLFTRQWLAGGKVPLLAENQSVVINSNGTAEVTCLANSLEDVARWVVARGGEVIARSPEELVNMVVHYASCSVKAHESLQ
ncbi:MAG: WYL domain-containing protein [Ignavibacteria bacterium]|nr:WYL domain-containing protein [Ignavibacteria bacterium]